MKTKANIKLRRWLIWLLPMLAVGMLLVACDGNTTEEGGGGGLAETPVTGEEPLLEPTESIFDETPMVEESPMIEETPADDIVVVETPITITPVTTTTEDVTPLATEVMTTAVPTLEATPVITDDEDMRDDDMTGMMDGPHAIMRASEFMGMTLVDEAGEEIGDVVEALADESGMIQYVIVDWTVMADADEDDAVTETMTETTGIDMMTMNTAVLTWDDLRVEENLDTADDLEDVHVVFTGDQAMVDTIEPELDFLNEEGYVLEDDDDGDFDVPVEYNGLLQVGDYDAYEFADTAENDLGDVEDLLIDMSTGQILYAVADVGGFLGIGANSVAIPWESLQLNVVSGDADVDESEIFTLDATEDFLTNAPTIDLDDWNPLVEEDWDLDFQDYWTDMMS